MNPTTITNIDIPFGRLVAIILKVILASIPAVLLLYLILAVISFIVFAILGGVWGLSGAGAEWLKNLEGAGPQAP
ncbi:MAG: hypothetical protein WD342_01895 [Verrucomicrobiales bacterium]